MMEAYFVKILKVRGSNVLPNPHGLYFSKEDLITVLNTMDPGDQIIIEKQDLDE